MGCITLMPIASCLSFPFSASCNDMLTMFVCATHWPSIHLYTLAHMSMHESCLLVCCPYFNTMKLWKFDPNLHLSLVDTTFYMLSCLFACFLVSLLAMSIMLIYFMPLSYAIRISFFPLLVCWFLILFFACTHTKQGCMELEHGLPGASKKGKDVSMYI